MTTLTKAEYLAALHRDATALRAVAVPDTLASPVPSCPGWTMRDLVGHLGNVYARLQGIVARASLSPPEEPLRAGGHPEGDEVLPWFDERYTALAGTLREADGDSPAWNWAPAPKNAAFWFRRAAHETAVHRWDAQVAVALPEPIEDKLAADGVSEVLDAWLPAGRRKGPVDLEGLVHLEAADTGDEWYVRLRGERIAVLDAPSVDPEEKTVATRAMGPASDVELALYGRVPFEVLRIEGDPALLEGLRTG